MISFHREIYSVSGQGMLVFEKDDSTVLYAYNYQKIISFLWLIYWMACVIMPSFCGNPKSMYA